MLGGVLLLDGRTLHSRASLHSVSLLLGVLGLLLAFFIGGIFSGGLALWGIFLWRVALFLWRLLKDVKRVVGQRGAGFFRVADTMAVFTLGILVHPIEEEAITCLGERGVVQ